MKILNLYAGIGGSRRHWGYEHNITAVEIEPETARVYQHFNPGDQVVVGDAHQYLLDPLLQTTGKPDGRDRTAPILGKLSDITA